MFCKVIYIYSLYKRYQALKSYHTKSTEEVESTNNLGRHLQDLFVSYKVSYKNGLIQVSIQVQLSVKKRLYWRFWVKDVKAQGAIARLYA